MRHIPLITIALSIFIVTFFVSELSMDHVSPETRLREYRSLFQVKHVFSSTSTVQFIERTRVPLEERSRVVMNKNRTLRAWVSNAPLEPVTIIVEQVRPRITYEVMGNFFVSPERSRVTFSDSSNLVLCGVDGREQEIGFLIDLHTGVVTHVGADLCR